MAATLRELLSVRSRLADAQLGYLQALESRLATNALLARCGRNLDDLRISLSAQTFDATDRNEEQIRLRESLRHDADPDRGGQRTASRRAYAASRTPGGLEDERRSSKAPPQPLDTLAAQLSAAVILGDPGSGKTEWLKALARRTARDTINKLEAFERSLDEVTLPVFVTLGEINNWLAKADPQSLVKTIKKLGLPGGNPSDAALGFAEAVVGVLGLSLPLVLQRWIWARLLADRSPRTKGGVLLCLDAWDEAGAEKRRLGLALREFSAATPAKIFLTSRIVGYDANVGSGTGRSTTWQQLELCPFEWSQVGQFVQSFFLKQPGRAGELLAELSSKPRVTDMATNPLLATLLCMAFLPEDGQPPLNLPARRVEIYDRVLRGLLGKWPR